MLRLTKLAAIGLALLLAVAGTAFAATSGTLQYQGRLTDAAGTALNGSFNCTFTIYADSAGTVPLWSEVRSVTVANGQFSITLGTGTAIAPSVFNGVDRFLGIMVDPDVNDMQPRQRLSAVAYAMRSFDAENSAGIANKDGAADVAVAAGATVAVVSVTITVPAAGYVLLEAGGVAYQSHTNGGGDDWLMLTVSETASSVNFGPGFNQVLAYNALPSATYFWPISPSRVVSASAGTHTYYLNAKNFAGASAAHLQYPTIRATYFPSLVGSLSGPPAAPETTREPQPVPGHPGIFE